MDGGYHSHFANNKLDPLKNKPSSFAPFLSYRSTSELFQIEAGVILGEEITFCGVHIHLSL